MTLNRTEQIELCELKKLIRKEIRKDVRKFEQDLIQEIIEEGSSSKKIRKAINNSLNLITSVNENRKYGPTKITNRNELVREATEFYKKLYSDMDQINRGERGTPFKNNH